MSLENQRIGSYRLVRKLCANKNYQIYQAEHIRSFNKQIIQLAGLEGKLNNKKSRMRIIQKIESIRAINSPLVSSILKCDFADIKGKNYLYIRTPYSSSGSLQEWLQLRVKAELLSQQDADDIINQAREAVEVFHKSGIAHLDIELSSFMIEPAENPNRPRLFLTDFLPAVLYSESIGKDAGKSKKAVAGDRNALDEMERLLNQYVEKSGIEPLEGLKSPLQGLEKRLLLLEAENKQLQRRLYELEEEQERINTQLQDLRDEERKRLIQAEEEQERFMLDLQGQKESSDTKPQAGAVLASTLVREVEAPSTPPSTGNTSRSSRSWFWVPAGLLLLAILFAGTTSLFAGLFFFGKPVLAFFDSSSAKVTITQASYELTDNFIFTGVTHSISHAKTQSITVPATNVIVIPGKNATGTLTFHNTQKPCKVARDIPAGTLFTNSHGISVVTDHAVMLGTSCNATVPAHAVKIGPVGNIGAHSLKQTYHITIIVDNPAAFAGGQSVQRYTTVQQSDIDQARNNIAGRIKQKTLSELHMQLQPDEQYVSLPTCVAKATSDHQVNDVATQVTVTVTVTCKAEAYNPRQIISQSEQMLNTRAQALFGPNYMLSGEIQSRITHIATDAKHGTLITVVASGVWTYHSSSARTDQLAQLLTGMDKLDAHSIVSGQQGVQSVSINISNNGNTMPSKANSIHIAYTNSLVVVND